MKCSPYNTGRLSEADAQNPCAALDTEDIVLNLQATSYSGNNVRVENGYIGVRCRGDANVVVDELHISRIKNDALQGWSGGIAVSKLYINHGLPIDYSDKNHPDCGQFFGRPLASDVDQGPKDFDGLYIGYAECVVDCYDYEKDKKNGFVFSETCVYRNIVLFPNGIQYKSNSSAPYFIDSTNFRGAIIGSEEHPIDPEKVSNKGIRIGGQKDGAPTSEDITIHAYKGLNIVLSEQVKSVTNIIWYDKVEEVEEVNEQAHVNDYRMSPNGIKQLIAMEGSIPHVYLCEAGVETCGVGHALTLSELRSGKIYLSGGDLIDLRDGDLSNADIESLLRDDLVSRENAVNELVKVSINQSQFDALVSFAFNVGIGAFKNSTLLRELNKGNYSEVPANFRKWNIVTVPAKPKPIRRVSDGLVNRREKEVALWLSESDSFDLGGLIRNPQADEQVIDVPVKYKYPILADKEKRKTYEKLKPLSWSRTIWGVITGTGAVGALGGVGNELSNKLDEAVNNAINDPVGALQTTQNVTVDAAKLIDGVAGLQDLFLYGGIALIVVLLSVVVILLARIDDRRKGRR